MSLTDGHRHEHPSPEELTELAARARDEDAAEARRAAHACSQCGPELAELETLLVRSRSALERASRVEPAEGVALAARVLARTTRQETSVRGDVRLFGAFVAGRLRSSRLLRLAAASLLAHLIALPVLAWYVLDRPEPEPVRITIAPPADPVEWAQAEHERLPPLVLPALDSLPAMDSGLDALHLVADPGPVRRENALRLARFELSRGGPTPPALEEPDETRVEALLRARAELAAAFAEGRALPQALVPDDGADGAGELAATASLERALAAELLLDAYVLDGRRAGLARALDALCRGPYAPLEAAALARADAYGLLDAGQLGRLDAARGEARGRSDALGLALLDEAGEPNGRRVPLFEGPWVEALAEALSPAVRERGVAQAWLRPLGGSGR